MGINLSTVDLSNVEARASFEPIPASWQMMAITDSQMKPTSSNDGSQYMELTIEIIDGQYKGRKLFDRLNVVNSNQTTVDIAYKTLKSIYNALGKVRVNDSTELHGIPFKGKVRLRAARQEKDVLGNVVKEYGPSNDIGEYAHVSSEHVVGVPAGAGGTLAAGVAGAPTGVPVWAVTTPPPAATQPVVSPAANNPATWSPPGGVQPWNNNAAATGPGAPPLAAAPPPQPTLKLTATGSTGGLTLEDYRKQGWTDETLVQYGHAEWQAAAPPLALAAPGAPGAPPMPNLQGPPAATGAPGGATPPWAR